jgi:hypothetical protein
MRYYLWSEGEYKYIGDKLPELQLQFSLCTAAKEDDTSEDGEVPDLTGLQGGYMPLWTSDKIKLYDTSSTGSTSQAVSDYINARLNYLIAQRSKFGCFVAPFFVRAVYRLYDGSYSMATVPVLLIPNTSHHIRCRLEALTGNEKVDGCNYKLTMPNSYNRFFGWKLCAKVLSAGNLSSWKDIVSAVEVCVTPQVYPYKLDAYVRKLFASDECEAGYGIWANGRLSVDEDGNRVVGLQKEVFDDSDFVRVDNEPTDTSGGNYLIQMPMKTTEEYTDELLGSTQFYKVFEYSLDQVVEEASEGKFKRLKIGPSKLSNLVQQELLDESYDYRSHDTLIPRDCMVYNDRLNLFNIERRPFDGFPLSVMSQYLYDENSGAQDVYVYIHAGDGKTRIVHSSCQGVLSWAGLWFYYPDSRAYKMVIYFGDKRYELPLESHPFLNGSYYLAWSQLDVEDTAGVEPPTVVNDNIPELNKVYCSDAGNPYVFPSNGVYTVGTGRVLGVATIAEPLSTGQAGQFELMFLCSDGNFARSIAQDGTFSNKATLQRDVCVSASSITVMDHSVLYFSSRGVMVTNQSEVACLSEMLDGVPDALPADLKEEWQVPVSSIARILESNHIAYDYCNQRVLFFRNGGDAFVLSLRDKVWSTARFASVSQVVNIYPSSYVQYAATGNIVKLDSVYEYDDDSLQYKGLLYTRPLKLDTLQLKRLLQFALQGKGLSSRTYLYGSQDGEKWLLLGSTSALRRQHLVGHSFKYFRLAIETEMHTADNLSGVRIGYEVNKETQYR